MIVRGLLSDNRGNYSRDAPEFDVKDIIDSLLFDAANGKGLGTCGFNRDVDEPGL